MTRALMLAAVLTLAATGSFAADRCRDDHGKFIKCPPPAAVEHHPRCDKGKPCGGSCIAKDKVCHKPG